MKSLICRHFSIYFSCPRLATQGATSWLRDMSACATSASALRCGKQSCPPSSNAIPRAKTNQGKAMPSVPRGTPPAPARNPCRNRAETARRTPSQTTSLRDRAHSHLLRKRSDLHSSLLSNAHTDPRRPRKPATSSLSYPFMTELFICGLPLTELYLLVTLPTELFKCEPPLGDSTSWLSYSRLSHLLTEPFNCELPLGYSSTWLSSSIVKYLLITLPLDWAIQLLVSTEVSN